MKRCFCIPFTRVNSYEKLFLYIVYTRNSYENMFLYTVYGRNSYEKMFLYAPYIKIDLKNRKF